MKNVIYIVGFMTFSVIAFFAYDILKGNTNPCGQLFEQTSASLTTKINLLEKDTSLTIGRNRIQALSTSAQQVALSLQSCCIAAQTDRISGEQFLQCQSGTTTYASRLDAITARLAELEAQKTSAPITIAQADNPTISIRSMAPAPEAIRMPTSSLAKKKSSAQNEPTISELDQLINKALSASVNFDKNVNVLVK